ncbi:hypothetical protein K474DRAFT_1709283 [Panus rudis PR-1116 ss-1]|nr:hypothetical protein K474DRAFT_1709283 [Panus rudis PR-1116 ss-1]
MADFLVNKLLAKGDAKLTDGMDRLSRTVKCMQVHRLADSARKENFQDLVVSILKKSRDIGKSAFDYAQDAKDWAQEITALSHEVYSTHARTGLEQRTSIPTSELVALASEPQTEDLKLESSGEVAEITETATDTEGELSAFKDPKPKFFVWLEERFFACKNIGFAGIMDLIAKICLANPTGMLDSESEDTIRQIIRDNTSFDVATFVLELTRRWAEHVQTRDLAGIQNEPDGNMLTMGAREWTESPGMHTSEPVDWDCNTEYEG